MVWLNVNGYDGKYQLSEKGDLRSFVDGRNARFVKSCIASNGKRYVTLWMDGNRKNIMLHNLYAETFQVPVNTAMQILYEGYEGDVSAKRRVRTWLMEQIQSCEQVERLGGNMHDEILYLKSFLNQINNIV